MYTWKIYWEQKKCRFQKPICKHKHKRLIVTLSIAEEIAFIRDYKYRPKRVSCLGIWKISVLWE